MISPGKPKVFTAGAIVDNPDDLLEGQTYWFYLFKVAVGKSFCHRRREDEKKQDDQKLGAVLQLIADIRKDARSKKDYATSDKIRDQLLEAGIQLKDEKDGGFSWELV